MLEKLSWLATPKGAAFLGSLLAFLGVTAGAFGGHALKQKLNPQMLSIFEVGVRYQMYHALALFAIAWALSAFPHFLVTVSLALIFTGTLIFSGSLYILSLSGITAWGAITPIGGLLLLSGWFVLALRMFKD